MKKVLRRTFTTAQKKAIIQEAIDRRSVADVLKRHRMGDGQFYRWVKLYRPDWDVVFDPKIASRRKLDTQPVIARDVRERDSQIVRLTDENERLRRIVIDLMLKIERALSA